MEYTVKELSAISGVSGRTLRYYDNIGLFSPTRIAENGYRLYSSEKLDELQQILFYRELGMKLSDIVAVLNDSGFDRLSALKAHLEQLQAEKQRYESLILNVRKTISTLKGETVMNDNEKFEGFKKELIKSNEEKYGRELRERFGNEAIDESNRKVAKMSGGEWKKQEELSEKIIELLLEAMKKGDPECDEAKKACELHKEWLCLFWQDGAYSKQAHKALAKAYTEDERFKNYYDKYADGLAEFFSRAVEAF